MNTLYSININFSISSYTTISLLLSMLPQSLNNQYLLPLLAFYNNLTNDLTDQIIEFFTSFEFLSFIQNVLTDSSKAEILECSTLILINILSNNDNAYLCYLDFGMHQIISQIHNDDIVFTENKANIFCIFLKYNLNEYEQIQTFILNENLKNLQSKNDSFKCIAVKGLIHASRWSEFLYNFLLSNSVLHYLCDLLQNNYSIKLIRRILTLMIELINEDNTYLIRLLESNLISSLQVVVEQNENRCSSLCLDLYQLIILHESFDHKNFDFSFILSFQDKGYIAKKRCIEFITSMYENKIDILSYFDDFQKEQIIYLIDEVAQSSNPELYYFIANLYIYIENSECGNLLLSLLSENDEFKEFLFDSSESSENYRLLEKRIHDYIISSQ